MRKCNYLFSAYKCIIQIPELR